MTSNENRTTLDIKKDLVLANYQMTFTTWQSQRERVNTLRQWELTVLVAVLGFLVSQGINISAAFLVLTTIILFASLEVLFRGHMNLVLTSLMEMERLFSTESSTEKIVESYVFGGLQWRGFTFKQKLNALVNVLSSPDFLGWQFFLSMLFVTLLSLL